jgi:hypothetical protein
MNSNEKTQKPGCRRGLWKIPFIIAAIVAIKSALVMVLWNALIPDLFHGPTLEYLQAVGLTVLAKLLTGFGGRFGGGPPWRRGHHWAHLSPEQREKLRAHLREGCGRDEKPTTP